MAGFIVAQREQHQIPFATSCRALKVSQAWFYKWRHGDPSPRHARRARLKVEIARSFAAHRGTYGSPRITADLRAAGEVVSTKTVAKLMRDNQIRGISPRPWRPVTTIIDPNPHQIPDLVQRRFDHGALNVVWTSDITYLDTGEGWLYLAAVRDGCSRRDPAPGLPDVWSKIVDQVETEQDEDSGDGPLDDVPEEQCALPEAISAGDRIRNCSTEEDNHERNDYEGCKSER